MKFQHKQIKTSLDRISTLFRLIWHHTEFCLVQQYSAYETEVPIVLFYEAIGSNNWIVWREKLIVKSIQDNPSSLLRSDN